MRAGRLLCWATMSAVAVANARCAGKAWSSWPVVPNMHPVSLADSQARSLDLSW